MPPSFSYTKENKDSATYITIAGTIDEDTILDDAFSEVLDTVIINISKVTHINSCGIRTWVNAVEALSSSRDVSFAECSVC